MWAGTPGSGGSPTGATIKSKQSLHRQIHKWRIVASPATCHSWPLPSSTWLHADVKTLNTAHRQFVGGWTHEHLRTSRANVLHSVERGRTQPEETARSTLIPWQTWLRHHRQCRLTCECWVMQLDQFLRLLVYVGDKKLKKKKTRECQMCNLLFNLKKML